MRLLFPPHAAEKNSRTDRNPLRKLPRPAVLVAASSVAVSSVSVSPVSALLLPALLALLLTAGAQSAAAAVVASADKPAAHDAGSSAQAPTDSYLGVDLVDITPQKARSLNLPHTRGALITLIDHDAPAGKAGLQIDDVVLRLNGQPIENAEQLRRLLREIPPGRKITLEISRDGSPLAVTAQLADRKVMERDIWSKIVHGGGLFGGDSSASSGFHIPFFGGGPNVGVLLEPLTPQMAQSLGVHSGLIVRQVAPGSQAAAAGLRAFDVLLKAGSAPLATLSAWTHLLRMNQGSPVQITILRDRRRQTLTLEVAPRRHSQLQSNPSTASAM